MASLHSSWCYRCMLLDEQGNPHSRVCTVCRTTETLEAERLAEVEDRKARERLYADRLDGTWQPLSGRVLAASAAVTLMLAGQAQAAPLEAPDASGFYGIITLCLIAGSALICMFLTGRWSAWRRLLPDVHAAPYGDIPNLPQGRGE